MQENKVIVTPEQDTVISGASAEKDRSQIDGKDNQDLERYVMPGEKVEFKIRGMHCAACVQRVEKKLLNSPGVTRAAVNLATEKAAVEYDSTSTTVEALKKAVFWPDLLHLSPGFF